MTEFFTSRLCTKTIKSREDNVNSWERVPSETLIVDFITLREKNKGQVNTPGPYRP